MPLYLFDIDGTILLSGGAGYRALNAIFSRRYGIDDATQGIRAGGKTDPGILREMFERSLGRGPREDETASILDEYVPLLAEELPNSDAFRTMPHVFEVLDYLEQKPPVVLGIATGNVQGGARAKLEHIGLWDRFAIGGYGDDNEDRAKLVERAIERGREHAGRAFSSDEIVVVGDTPRDVAAARACGIRVVTVATGQASSDELGACDPDASFETLAELPAWHEATFPGANGSAE
jgi:phosphoglycolate phosphatase-like HAD superfamily hydrolase